MERTRVKYGLLHNHTMESRRDSAMSVQTLVDRAKELGAPAVVLTVHGVMAISILRDAARKPGSNRWSASKPTSKRGRKAGST